MRPTDKNQPDTKELVRELTDIVKHHPPERHVVLYETEPFLGYGEVLFFDRNGVHVSVEAMGMWVAYAKDVPKPRVTDLSRKELQERLEKYGSDARAMAYSAIEEYRRDHCDHSRD